MRRTSEAPEPSVRSETEGEDILASIARRISGIPHGSRQWHAGRSCCVFQGAVWDLTSGDRSFALPPVRAGGITRCGRTWQFLGITRSYEGVRRLVPRAPLSPITQSRQETHQRRPDAAVGGLGSPRRRAIRKRDPGQTIVYLNGTAVPDPFKRTLNCGGAHKPLCIV